MKRDKVLAVILIIVLLMDWMGSPKDYITPIPVLATETQISTQTQTPTEVEEEVEETPEPTSTLIEIPDTPTPIPPRATPTFNWIMPQNIYFISLNYPDMKDVKEYEVSEAGMYYAQFWEGFIAYKYNDGLPVTDEEFYDTSGNGRGNCTIGYGHLLHLGPCNGSEGWGGGIKKSDAVILLLGELNHCGTYVKKYVKVKVTQTQYDIMAALVCGWGYEPFSKSKFLTLLNQGYYVEAAEALKTTAIYGIGSGLCPGLVRRREYESVMFLKAPDIKVFPLTQTPRP